LNILSLLVVVAAALALVHGQQPVAAEPVVLEQAQGFL
jgi:hypothetical protein